MTPEQPRRWTLTEWTLYRYAVDGEMPYPAEPKHIRLREDRATRADIEAAVRAAIQEIGGQEVADEPPCVFCGSTAVLSTGGCAECFIDAILAAIFDPQEES